MRQTWNKTMDSSNGNEGHTIPRAISMFPETYRPKYLSKAPSQRAIDNYNNISTEPTFENLAYVRDTIHGGIEGGGDSNFSTMSSTRPLNGDPMFSTFMANPLRGHIYAHDDTIDYATIRTSSGGTITATGSEADISRREEHGSTTILFRPKISDSCSNCLSYVETALCTTSFAFGLGNIYRLPQAVLGGGGLPFLIAYIVLAVLVGLPLLILEIGLGQIVQEGFTKTWRAVPFFRGVGYIKLLAGCLVSLYYPLYMGLSVYYIIWFSKSTLPFSECAVVKMKTVGYRAVGISGQECIKKTFLESPFTAPYWFGIFTLILLIGWIIIIAWLVKRTKTYVTALIIYLVCTLGCFIALIVRGSNINFQGIEKLGEDADWTILGTANVWYYAAVQVFFATHLGFGIFLTNSGIIYKKVNPVAMAIGYTIMNLIVGILAVLLCYTLSASINPIPKSGDITQIHLLTLIYDVTLTHENYHDLAWSIIAYFCILFSGFISMTTILYTVLKAIRLETRKEWWQVAVFIGILGFLLSTAILLSPSLQIVHMFDHYVVGNLIMLTVILEVGSLATFYGQQRIQSDFEFILGRRLSAMWSSLWCFCPVLLLGISIWGFACLPLNGYIDVDPIWLYATGWAIVLLALLFILTMGIFHITKQDEYYTFYDKLKAALKFSRKWGPVDPIMRYNWVQWHSKAKEGERDFTLRRKGTRDYTHSVKNRSKYSPTKYTPGALELSMNDTTAYKVNDQNQNNITLTNLSNFDDTYHIASNGHLVRPLRDRPLRITSLVDTLDPPISNKYLNRSFSDSEHRVNLNPLAQLDTDLQNEVAGSEGYGTFRNGPYIINSEDLDHVCHRKNSHYSEDATEL